jgi:hypothetical protein
VSTWRTPVAVKFSNGGGHVICPEHPTHLSGYVMFNHCQTSSPFYTGALSCCNYNIYYSCTVYTDELEFEEL